MNWPIKEFAIEELYLDSKNIRIPTNLKTQNALIQDLFTNEDAFDIVKSLSHNSFYPDEVPIAIKERGKLIIIEGNRRLAALKALSNPDIVPAYRNKIKSLKSKHIKKINVSLAPSRQKVTTLLANKHTTVLRRNWRPLRQAYFYQSQIDNGKSISQLINEYPDHEVIKFIRMLEMHKLAKSIKYDNGQINEKVHDERKFPITNLQRMYDDENVKSFLGIKFNKTGEVSGSIKLNEFQKGYKKIVEDVATGDIDSRKFNTSEERKKYVDSFSEKLTPKKTQKGHFTSKSAKEIKIPKDEGNEKKELSHRVTKTLFQKSKIPYRINSSSLRILYEELAGINIKNFPNATHDLLRSFLECALVIYLKEKNEYNSICRDPRHNPKLTEMLTHIASRQCSLISDTNIKQVIRQIKSQYAEPYSLERMNMIKHNENWISSESEIRTAWAKIESLIKILLNP